MIKLINLTTFLVIVSNLIACSSPMEEIIIKDDKPVVNQYDLWCQATIDAIDRDFKISGTDSYYENQNRDNLSFIWGNIFLLYTYTSGVQLNSDAWTSSLSVCVSNTDRYWTEGYLGKDGYATQPVTQGVNPDRYYDENGWMSLGLSDAYMVTKQDVYLQKAKDALAFSLSGEDDILGGGIYFQETFSIFEPQKNAICSAVAMIAALKLYKITNDDFYLQVAIRLNDWTINNLLDVSDNLLWDAKMVGDGSVNKTKWSYNAGFMIQAWLMMYEATAEEKYLTQAKQTLASSETMWYDDKSGALKNPGYFAFTIVDAWYAFYDLTADANYLKKAFKVTDFIHNNLKDTNGRYPESWENAVVGSLTEWDLRFATVVAHTYAKAAIYKEKYNNTIQ